jgi:ribonuclease Z
MGEGAQRELMRHRLGFGSIRNVFISHLHMDHFLGLYGYLETMRLTSAMEKGDVFTIYAPAGFEDIMHRESDFIRIRHIREGILLKGEDFTISAFRNRHRPNSYGFIFQENERIRFHEAKAKGMGINGPMFREITRKGKLTVEKKTIKLEDVTYREKGTKVVYTGDTAPFPELAKHAKGADILIHECTFSGEMEKEAHKRRHSTAKDAGQLAQKAGAKTLVLTHISPRYAQGRDAALAEEAAKLFKGKILLAHDGMRLEI